MAKNNLFLRVLGFPDLDGKILKNDELFFVPNKDAFQKVIHFLLCKLDKEKSETLFRDCWPIFDKKMEAEFRRVCFNWYKELQMKHPNELPAITASLFQSPGGRKFINFISHFVRFVTKEIIRRSESQVWQPKDLKIEPVKNLMKGCMIENSQVTKNEFEEFRGFAGKSQNLSSSLSLHFRQIKSDYKEAKSENEQLCKEISNIESLRRNCEKLKCENQDLKLEFQAEKQDLQNSLNQIGKIGGQNAEKFILDLSAYNDPSLKSVLEKLLGSTLDLKLSHQAEPKLNFPFQDIQTNLQKAEKQHSKFVNLQSKLNADLTNAKLNNTTYDQKSLDKGEPTEISVLLPVTPGVRIQHDQNPEFPKSKFLLENSKSEIPPEMSVCSDVGLKVSTPNTTTAVLMSPEQSRIVHHPYKLDLTPKPIKLDSSFDKSGFSSLAEDDTKNNETRRFLLSPKLLDSSPLASLTPSAAAAVTTPISRMNISSPRISGQFANTPAGKRLAMRLNELMTTLAPSTDTNESLISPQTSFLLGNTTPPDFSHIGDFEV